MNRRYVGLIIAEAVIIMILLIGVAVLYMLFNGSASASPLPIMPTYNSIFSTTTPPATLTSAPTNISSIATLTFGIPTSSVSTSTPTPTPTPTALYILNGTPVYATTTYNTPTRTPTPLVASVWTYTPTPATSSPSAQTCRNILYPVAAGQQWQYQVTALSRTDLVNMSVVSVNNSQGNVSITNQTTGSTKQIQVQCDGDVIRSFPFMSMDALFGSVLSGSMTANYISGVLAPNEAAFLKNNWAMSWSSLYGVTGTSVINQGGTSVNISLSNAPVTLTCQTLASGDAAFESVTVAAGTFRALKVVCTQQGQVTAVVNGVTVTGLVEGRSNQWFAPKVGLIKMQVVSASVTVFNIPVSLLSGNNMELRSFISAP